MSKKLNIKKTEQKLKNKVKTMQEEWKEYTDFLKECKKKRK